MEMPGGQKTLYGKWWIEGYEADAVGGYMEHEPDGSGVTLHLQGGLRPNAATDHVGCVLGDLSSDERAKWSGVPHVSLLDCVRTAQRSWGFSADRDNVASEQWMSTTPVFGAFISATTKFDRVALTFAEMGTWAALDHLGSHVSHRVSPSVTVDDSEGFTEDVSLVTPPLLTSTAAIGTISVTSVVNTSAHDSERFEAQRETWFVVKFAEPKSIDELWSDVISPISTLVSFGIEDAVSSPRMRLWSNDVTREVRKDVSFPAELTLLVPGFRSRKEERSRKHPWQLLLSLQRLKPDFDTLMRRWFEIHNELGTTLDLLGGLLQGDFVYIDSQFLAIAQACEIYHRQRFDNFVLPKNEHKARVKELIASSPPAHKEWLQAVLGNANEPRLVDRITQLIDQTNWDIAAAGWYGGSFAKAVKNTRNFLTHRDPKTKQSDVAENEDLYWMTQSLVALLEVQLLLELGFTSVECRNMLGTTTRWRSLCRSSYVATLV